MKKTILYLFVLLLAGCKLEAPKEVTVEVMNPITPVKNQGSTQYCWAYSMLAAIETEQFRNGDSVNLPIEPLVEAISNTPNFSPSGRAMGPTFLNLAKQHGLYREVCDADDYIPLCTNSQLPYGEWVVLDLPDNWEHNRFLNLEADTLLEVVKNAVINHRGICWEGDISERGFSFEKGIARMRFPNGHTSDDHCMAIVGIVHDQKGRQYFVMKNSWGTYNPYGGLMLMSFDYFKRKTIAVVLPKDSLKFRV